MPKEPRYKYGLADDDKTILIGDGVHRDLFARAPNTPRNLELVKQIIFYANKGYEAELKERDK